MIKVVLPDSGPLISLALAGRLDLLEGFKGQLIISDVVAYEATQGTTSTPDADVIRDWIRNAGNQVVVMETTMGGLLRELEEYRRRLPAKERAQVKRRPATKDAGELSILELAARIKPTLTPDDSVLVLFEDRRALRMDFGENARVMSTWSFALALESGGVIESADRLFEYIEGQGRAVLRTPFDRIPANAPDEFAGSYDTGHGGSGERHEK